MIDILQIRHEFHHKTGRCKFLPSMDRTSLVNRNASNIGNKFNRAVSEGSANQETIGIALSVKQTTRIKIFREFISIIFRQ